MAFAMEQQFINHNRSGVKFVPIGLIVHSTANPGATAQNNRDYFNSGERDASAHVFSDWLPKAIQCIPFDEEAWHAFAYANAHFLSWEICEATNAADFQKGWDFAVEGIATMLIQNKWDPAKDMHSHKWVSDNYQGDHQDPIPYLTKWGKTWDQFVAAVKEEMVALLPPVQDVDLLRVVNADALNVRSDPDPTATVRYVLKKDQVIHLSKLQGDWAFTTYGDLGGWVNRAYLRAQDPPTPVLSPAPATPPGTPILGEAKATAYQLRAFARAVNPFVPADAPDMYLQKGALYGVRGDIAFCQMLKETNYLRFGGDVKPQQNNFAGIGAVGGGVAGASFATPADGVTAHIQHLFAYASTADLPTGETQVDPRFKFVARGTALNWEDLNGKWAVPGTTYGQDILALYAKVLALPVDILQDIKNTPPPPAAPVFPSEPSHPANQVTVVEVIDATVQNLQNMINDLNKLKGEK